MTLEPGFHFGMLVGGVHDEVQLQFGRSFGVDLPEETQELLMPVARQTGTDDLAVECAQRREQCRRAVAFVVMGLCALAALTQRQARLRAVQRLNLAFSSTHKTKARSGGAK